MSTSPNSFFVAGFEPRAKFTVSQEERSRRAEAARHAKMLKRTLVQNELASASSFLEVNGVDRAAARAHLEALEVKNPENFLIEDEHRAAPVSPSVVTPSYTLSLVKDHDDDALTVFVDDFGCAFVRVAPDLIEVPLHAVEHVAYKSKFRGELAIEIRSSHGRHGVSAVVVRTDVSSDSMLLMVPSEYVAHIPITAPLTVQSRVEAVLSLSSGCTNVWLQPIRDGSFCSPQPNSQVLSEGFSGVGAIVGGRCVARLRGATEDRAVLVWSPCQDRIHNELVRSWAFAGACPLIPLSKQLPTLGSGGGEASSGAIRLRLFGRSRNRRRFTDYEYSKMSNAERRVLRDQGGEFDGHDYASDVSVLSYEDEFGDLAYNSTFGFSAHGSDDFQANARLESHQVASGGTRKQWRFQGEKIDEWSKKKKKPVMTPTPHALTSLEASLAGEIQHVVSFTTHGSDDLNPFSGLESDLPPLGPSAQDDSSGMNPFDSAESVFQTLQSSGLSAAAHAVFVETALERDVPGLRSLPVDSYVPKIMSVPTVNTDDVDFVRKAKDAAVILDINRFNEQIAAYRSEGVFITKIVELSPHEMESLRGLHAERRLAEKIAKEYREKAKYDQMLRDKAANDAKKFQKAQDSMVAMQKQMAALQVKLASYKGEGNF